MEINIPSKAFIRVYLLYDVDHNDKRIYVLNSKFKNIFESVIEPIKKIDTIVFEDIKIDNRTMDFYDEYKFSSAIMNYVGDDIEKFKIKMKLAL